MCIQFFVIPEMIEDKSYGVIYWLNNNLKARTVWYLLKENRSDIETWSIDRLLNKEPFYRKSVQ